MQSAQSGALAHSKCSVNISHYYLGSICCCPNPPILKVEEAGKLKNALGYCIIYLEVAKMQILNVLVTKKKWQLCDVREVLANAIMVIILQYISTSSQHVHTLNLHNVICLSKAGKNKEQFWEPGPGHRDKEARFKLPSTHLFINLPTSCYLYFCYIFAS